MDPDFPDPFERPFDWQIPSDLLDRPILPCRINFKQGCYQIVMEPTGVSPFPLRSTFKGSMRVEHGADHSIVSGDLYRFRRWKSPVLSRGDLIGFFVNATGDEPGPVIPIYPRNRYYSYLKVVQISISLFTLLKKSCTITLKAEEYQYTHPDAGEATGNFPETPDRVLTIVLRRVADPEGYAGPSFEGSVYEGGTLLPYKFSMLWVSDFYRRAQVEVENVTGGTLVTSAGVNDFSTVYATAGWDVTILTGDADLAVPADASSTDPWSRAELHAFMLANRNPATNLNFEWRIYYLTVPFDLTPDSGTFGVMFDHFGEQREGACNFADNLTGVHDDDRARLRSACHEVGHAFNLFHPPDEGLENDNSIMSKSGAVRELIQDSGGTYPDDINFVFNEHNRHHLIHSPDVVVRPGGEDFEFGHNFGFSPEAEDNAEAAQLDLDLKIENDPLTLGEPLTIQLTLTNHGQEAVRVPKNIGTAFRSTEITVGKSGERARHYHSFVLLCDGQADIELKPGKSIVSNEVIYWDRNGCVFDSPGSYTVSASITWDTKGQPFSATTSARVFVDYPLTKADNDVAALLLNDEVGKYVALGGNARHLKEAVSRIKRASELAEEHSAVQRLRKLDNVAERRSGEMSATGNGPVRKKEIAAREA
jgi:hypothetical protein